MENRVLTFNHSKTIPIPGNYRFSYRLCQLVLILKISSTGEKSSLLRLHFLSWVMKDPERMIFLLEHKDDLLNSNITSWGIDPALNRALIFATADSFVKLTNDSYKLTNKGNALYDIIITYEEFLSERTFLEKLGKKLTQKSVDLLSKKWLKNA